MQASETFLDADQLRAATFVRHVELHDTLGSTNDRAAELARDTTIELPALIVARLQTAGRGRGKHTWWSGEGALTFSLLIDPAAQGISTHNWPQLSLATAVAVCDAIELRIEDCGMRIDETNPQSEIRNPKSSFRLGIKWPNDVFINGRKVAGILIESPGGPAPAKNRLIIGVGININNSWRTAPREAGPGGCALCDATGRRHDLQRLLAAVIGAMADRIDQLRARDTILIQAWRQLDLIAGQHIVLKADDRCIEGKCVEVAFDGALVIDTAVGRQRFYSGSVRMS